MHAVPILEHQFFPWKGLPYPQEHAKLGLELMKKGETEKAQKMAVFQQATLDHNKKPLFSLFRQEKGVTYKELEEANRLFFEAAEIEPTTEYSFIESELGMLLQRDANQTIMLLASGCKSGMGAFLIQNSGVLNFGPQLRPLGECGGFGLAGRGRHIKISESLLSYQCRLAAPHSRDTGISWLEDSGYSGAWIENCCAIVENTLEVKGEFVGFRTPSDFLFTFFVKADACYVAATHKLNPRSLDRYEGPPQLVVIEEVTILPEKGFNSMKVIPLAGDESYWGADFLIALTLEKAQFQFKLK